MLDFPTVRLLVDTILGRSTPTKIAGIWVVDRRRSCTDAVFSSGGVVERLSSDYRVVIE